MSQNNLVGPTSSKKKKRKKSESDSETGEYKSTNLVFDSDDDSDVEISNKMTALQQRVLDFLNTAAIGELVQVPSCSQTKAAVLIDNRPFSGWRDLVKRLGSTKSLGTSLLNATANLLKTRDTVSNLMTKCVRIAEETESSIVEGSGKIREQPSIMNQDLRLKGYQMVGLNWLYVMYQQELSAILADEMGLGKTIQIIAFLAHLTENNLVKGPHLVVAPTSTIENWSNEFARWCPSISVHVYHGSMDERRRKRVKWFKQNFEGLDVMITTYNLISASNEEKKMFKIIPFEYVVFDEAHMLKNMNTQRYFNLFAINAKHRILLTGTPLQNNLLELMSLLNFVMPDMFSSKITHIKTFFSKNTKMGSESASAFEQKQVELAKRIMKPFILRRLKQDVLQDLPEKTMTIYKVSLSVSQKEKYNALKNELRAMAEAGSSVYNHMSAFMQLRRLANHPLAMRYYYEADLLDKIAGKLADEPTYKKTNKQYVFEDLSFMSDVEIHQLAVRYKCISNYKLPDELFLDSGKFEKLDEILPVLKEEGHRVIVFSQFIFVLDLLEEYMKLHGHRCLRLDGQTGSFERQDLIDSYNEDSSIFAFLLTTKAGGVGINLTTADTVIIHDVDFNPYNDKQAEDRCHRVGQTKPVHVIRLISEGTVEEAIYTMAQNKLSLEQELTSGADEESEDRNVEILIKEVLGL